MSELEKHCEIYALGNLEDRLNDRVLERGCKKCKEKYFSNSRELALKIFEQIQEEINTYPNGDYCIILAHQTGGESHHIWKKVGENIPDEEAPYIVEALNQHYRKKNIFLHILTLQREENSSYEPQEELPYTLN